MFFRKYTNAPTSGGADKDREHVPEELHQIDYDMMLKGTVVMRRGKPVRQLGVTVNGCTRLVTSGDKVDRQTYEALVGIGAIRVENRPIAAGAPHHPPKSVPLDEEHEV